MLGYTWFVYCVEAETLDPADVESIVCFLFCD